MGTKVMCLISIFPGWDGERQETSLFKNLGMLKLQDGGPASYKWTYSYHAYKHRVIKLGNHCLTQIRL